MEKGRSLISVISLIVSAATLILVLFLVFFMPGDHKAQGFAEVKGLAGELADNNLYRASVEEYKRALNDPNIDRETAANIDYMVGRIYFENLADYENAAAYYVRARALNPRGSFYDEAGKNLIYSLEKMGRVMDAKRELDRTVNIDSLRAGAGGKVIVARVGERPIYMSDVENDIQSFPLDMQKKFMDKKGKMEILMKRISLELMYQDAVRNGMDKDSDVLQKQKDLEKQVVVDKYYAAKILPQVNIDTSDVKYYYLANKKEKYGDKSYDDVRVKVLVDYQQEKSQRAFSDYIARLAAIEKLQVFEENIK